MLVMRIVRPEAQSMSVEVVVDLRAAVSVRSWMLFGAAKLMLRPVLANWPLTQLGMLPMPLVDLVANLLPPPRGTRVSPVSFGKYGGEWVRADSVADDGAVLYFHGGAFMVCGLNTHRRGVARISAACGLPVLSVAYRQLPAVSLNGSVDDCLGAYRWLLREGLHPDRIVFAGDSAGGHLAFATALRALDEGLPAPAGIVGLSPWLDLDCAAKFDHPNVGRDAYTPLHRLPVLARLCAGGAAELDPLLSPVNCDLRGLPPTLLMVAESEILLCDAELMAQRLAAADVECTLQIWEGQVHAFPVLGHLLPESQAAILEIGSFVRRMTAVPSIGDEEIAALAG